MKSLLVNCPGCQTEIPVSVDMYIDSGDVCYEIIPNPHQMIGIEKETAEGLPYMCLSCVEIVEFQIDSDYWGSEDAPLQVKSSPPVTDKKKAPIKTKIVSCDTGQFSIDVDFKVDILGSVTNGIETIIEKRGTETEVTLGLADLQYIRSLLVADAVRIELSAYNLKESLAYRKMKKEENSNE